MPFSFYSHFSLWFWMHLVLVPITSRGETTGFDSLPLILSSIGNVPYRTFNIKSRRGNMVRFPSDYSVTFQYVYLYQYQTPWLDIKKKVVIFNGIFCSWYFSEQWRELVSWEHPILSRNLKTSMFVAEFFLINLNTITSNSSKLCCSFWCFSYASILTLRSRALIF